MATIDCSACSDLQDLSPSFVANGVTTSICTSLKNDTGLNPNLAVLHTDCEDLDTVNDCLVGRMAEDIEKYDVCDWKKYMRNFVPNVWQTIKAGICSLCGIWENIHTIWCWLENLTRQGKSYTIHAYEDDDPTKSALNGFRIADGITVRTGSNTASMRIHVMGHHIRFQGSLKFEGNMPSSYTNGDTVPWSYLEHGCANLTNQAGENWGKDGICETHPFIYEYQLKSCEYGFSDIWGKRMDLLPSGAGDFCMHTFIYRSGDLVPPDYSDTEVGDAYYPGYYTYNPDDDDMMLIQVRLQRTRVPLKAVSPRGTGVCIACPDSWSC